jgi:hypothetical protein
VELIDPGMSLTEFLSKTQAVVVLILVFWIELGILRYFDKISEQSFIQATLSGMILYLVKKISEG